MTGTTRTKVTKLMLNCGVSGLAISLLTMGLVDQANAQTAPAPAASSDDTVVIVTGQRAALKSAQKIKQTSDEIVDSIVADDIGKLPDRSVTEALQRVVGVSIDHTMARGDPEHYSIEGSGVNIRGLSYVRSELNGRDSFSANGGRALNFEDVPPELMSGVDVYKNPSAEQIEGAIGGLVNLRTALPFDYKGAKASFSAQETYSVLKKGRPDPSASLLLSNRWTTGAGEFGALLDFAYSESDTRADYFQVEPYYPLTGVVSGKTVWVPKGSQWRTILFDRKRLGAYGALEWKPNADVLTTLTFFNSHYKRQWDENAIFSQVSSPYTIQVSSDATYDAEGALLSGNLTNPAEGGINFGDDTRIATREDDTTDVSWNLAWNASDRLSFKSDLQYIRSTTRDFDSTVATGVEMPSEHLDLTGDIPVITTNASVLSDPANYYWAFTMEHLDKSVAHEWSWKGDAKYDFDNSVLHDLRVGVRLTDRDSVNQNSNPSYNWTPVSQTWQVGWNISGLAYLNDPRFNSPTMQHPFTNFFNGKANAPSLIFPALSLALGYPDTYTTLNSYHDVLCGEAHGGDSSEATCGRWHAATFGNDPAGTNDQKEKTAAVYTQLRFGWDDLPYPIDGNVGVRYVSTDMTANGYTVFTQNGVPAGATGVPVPTFNFASQASTVHHTFNDVLPSLNLRMKVTPQFQLRLALAKAIARPDFSQLQNYTTLTAGFNSSGTVITGLNDTGSGSGNPNLLPTSSTQLDLTAEWYFSPVGSLTLALFHKDLHDVVINQVYNIPVKATDGQTYQFSTTAPVNGADGKISGVELAYQQYYDMLPGWMSGFGVQANFTYVNSKQSLYHPVTSAYCSPGSASSQDLNVNLNLNGCDLDGRTFSNLPLTYLSKYTYNLALLYDKGPISARLAYNWRSKYLQAVNVNGTQGSNGTDTNPASATFGQQVINWGLPTWAADYGELDASFLYKITDKLTLGIEGQNLTDSIWKQTMQQHIGDHGREWVSSGQRYSATVRYTF